MDYLLVGIGGIFGSITRYVLGRAVSEKSKSLFPFGTFLINITGAFLLGVVISIPVSKSVYLLAAEGFLGAYTTFSTFMYEGFNLFDQKKNLNAAVYIAASLLLGIIFFILGAAAGKAF